MNELKYNYSNYNLTPLQLENSLSNEKEFESGAKELRSYPRRLVIALDGTLASGESKEFYNPRRFGILVPAMNYSEELILFSSVASALPDNVQPILDQADDYKIKKSVAADVTNLSQLSPWVFQYNVGKVHILIDVADITSVGMDTLQRTIRELVVRKYFANTKPVINLVYRISDITEDIMMPMLMLPYETEADGISLVFSDSSENTEEFISQVKEKTDYYGIVLKSPFEGHGDMHYSAWSDLCINNDGKLLEHLNGMVMSVKAPDPEASFLKDIWNSTALIKLRSESGNRDYHQLKKLYNHVY